MPEIPFTTLSWDPIMSKYYFKLCNLRCVFCSPSHYAHQRKSE